MEGAKKVLVVEDYEDSREFMRCLLESFGYEVVVAADGFEALRVASEQSPDLIFMDISMPHMDGLTATREIRRHKGLEKTPIIAITAHDDSYHSKVIDAGCNDVLNKPLDFDELTPVLNQYLAV